MLIDISGDVAVVTIDRPTSRNALSPTVVSGLNAAIDAAIGAGCTVVVVRGRGGTLSAGADLKHLLEVLDDPVAVRAYISAIGATLDRLEAAPFVSVCVVDGYALAGGFEIMLACDLAVASERATLGDRHLEFGLVPGAGGSVRLSRALPQAWARRLLYTGETIDGRQAGEIGLVSHVAAADGLEATLEELLTRLTRHGPDALRLMKRLHARARAADPAQSLVDEREALLAHLGGATAREGLAAFAGRRAPDFASTDDRTNGVNRA